jgi:hypothetical protein
VVAFGCRDVKGITPRIMQPPDDEASHNEEPEKNPAKVPPAGFWAGGSRLGLA